MYIYLLDLAIRVPSVLMNSTLQPLLETIVIPVSSAAVLPENKG